MALRALGSRRVVGSLLPIAFFVLPASCSDFDTSRTIPARGTLGTELYGVVCDRVGAQALHEDLTGASYHSICHADPTTGQFGNTVDVTQLPALDPNAVNIDGKPVPLAQQQSDRAYAIARIQALGSRRSDFIAALDATFPDVMIAIKDNSNPDPTKSCGVPASGGEGRLHDQLADLLARFTPLYNDGTFPASTESLSRVMDAFKASPDAQLAYAQFDARQGYRPINLALGAVRPLIAYPSLRDFVNGLVSIISPDSNPYDPNPKLDAHGNRIPVPGPVYPQLVNALQVAHEEFQNLVTDPTPTPLPQSLTVDPAGRVVLPRPRNSIEILQNILTHQDPAFGSGNSHYIVQRDVRGWVATNGLPAPFVDMNGDGLADIDSLGRFVTSDGSTPPTPLLVPGAAVSMRDTFGRPVDGSGNLIYQYIDTAHTFAAQSMVDLTPLLNPDPTQTHETLMDALAGAQVLYGTRDGSPKSTRTYPPDPDAVANWNLTHPNGPAPPAGLANQPVVVNYNAFQTASSPILDLVYALGQMLGDPTIDDTLNLSKSLLDPHATPTSHTSDVARVVGDGLYSKNIADMHPEAKIPATSTLWDEMIDVMIQIRAGHHAEQRRRPIASARRRAHRARRLRFGAARADHSRTT